MAGKILRAFLFGLLAFILTVGASGFLLVRSAGVADQHINLLSRSRGRELIVALAAMAGESFAGPALVRMSATMNRVVSTSQGRADVFEVQELALVDREGKVRAHNDIAKAAGKAEPAFEGAKFDAVMNLPERDPVSYEVLESKSPQVPLPEFAEPYREQLAPLLPKLPETPERLMINAAVFRVDEQNASARLHMVVRLRSGALYQSGLLRLVLEGLAASGAVAFIIFVLALLLPGAGSAGAIATEVRPSAESDDESERTPAEQESPASLSTGTDDRSLAEEVLPLTDADFSDDLLATDDGPPLPEPIAKAAPARAPTPIPAQLPRLPAAESSPAPVSAPQPETHAVRSPERRPVVSAGPSAPQSLDRPGTVRIAQEDEIPDAIPLD